MIVDLQNGAVWACHCEIKGDLVTAGMLFCRDLETTEATQTMYDVNKLPERVAYTVELPSNLQERNYNVCLKLLPNLTPLN